MRNVEPFDTVDGSEIRITTRNVQNPENNGINYLSTEF